jgi:hypothetical protein
MGFSARKIFANDQKITKLFDRITEFDSLREMQLSESGDHIVCNEHNGNTSVWQMDSENLWNKKGQTILQTDLFPMPYGFTGGSNVKISANGNRIAFAYPSYGGGSSLDSWAVIFDWNGSSWVKLGGTIQVSLTGGINIIDQTISINSDASRILISIGNADNNTYKNAVFSWNGSSWVQLGSNINLQGVINSSMNSSGNRVVFSLTSPNVTYGGFVCFSWNGSSWVQLGQKIQGTGNQLYYTSGVCINQSGDKIAACYAVRVDEIEMFRTQLFIRFFSLSGESWVEIRDDLNTNIFSYITYVDEDNTKITISSTENIVSIFLSGMYYCIAYWNGTNWLELGNDYNYTQALKSGGMNSAGTIIAYPSYFSPNDTEQINFTRYLNK